MHCGRRPLGQSLAIIPSKGSKAMPLELVTVPCLTDNYAYLIHDPDTGQTAVIDVPEPGPILAALNAHQWRLTDILITHHHDDHIQGVDTLRARTGAMAGSASTLRAMACSLGASALNQSRPGRHQVIGQR